MRNGNANTWDRRGGTKQPRCIKVGFSLSRRGALLDKDAKGKNSSVLLRGAKVSPSAKLGGPSVCTGNKSD